MNRFVLVAAVWVLAVSWSLGAQTKEELKEGEKTVIELRQPAAAEARKAEPGTAAIGLDALREVLESGQYLVGPGDEFLVYLSGMKEPLYSEVLAEGGLFVPKVGMVPVGGLRLRAARRAIEEAFHRSFKDGEIDFELSQPRHFPVPVVGLVDRPGLVQVTGVERISEVLAKAGGLRPNASRRNIRVVQAAGLEPQTLGRLKAMAEVSDVQLPDSLAARRVDLDFYHVTGDTKYNPFVEDGDVVLVPPQQGQVGVLEAVQRPDMYEFVPGDRISTLLALALGPAPNHDPANVLLFRYSGAPGIRTASPVDLARVLAGEPQADLELERDDWLIVRALPGYHQRSEVSVTGEVVYPGYYVVDKDSTTLRQLIERAGYFTRDASLSEARVVRQQFVAEGVVDPEYERIRFIPVADRTEDENQYFIMKSREQPGKMVVDFVALFDEKDETKDIRLMPGDAVVVPALQRTVVVSGQAAFPGAVTYDPSYTVADYIARAGGLSWRASKDVRVIKARTGEVRRARDVRQIDPGDRIWIKEKPVRDYWAIFTQGMGVIGQVSTVVLLYVTITK